MKNLVTCLTVCVLSEVAFATTWTVAHSGKADFDNIQAAVDAASDGDEIVVMPGTYTSTQDGHVVNMLGKAVTLRSSDPSDPDVVAATIIDGENTRRGLACYNEETSKTIISGFTITNGYGAEFDYNGSGNIDWPSETNGGGMRNHYNSNPTLTNCIFKNNTAIYGGGMYNIYSSPTLIGCTFTNNNTFTNFNGGGGMHNEGSSPTLTNCTFTNNTADNGGGMNNYESIPTLTNCTFTANTATYGGGMRNQNSNPTLTNCTFTGNTSVYGGGMYSHESNPTLIDTIFCGNTPDQIYGSYIDGGGNTVTYDCPNPGACCTNDNCLVSEQENCLAFFGEWQGEGTTCEDNPCPTSCLGDLNSDGQVNVNDLMILIAFWGACP